MSTKKDGNERLNFTAFYEALELEPPQPLVCSDLHLQMEGYPVEQGAIIEIPLLPPGSRGPAKDFG